MDDREMIRYLSVISITTDYIDGKDTIYDLIDKFNNTIKSIDKVDNNYYGLASNYLCKMTILTDILSMKKFKDNREDALVLIELLRELTDGLEKVIKEVE